MKKPIVKILTKTFVFCLCCIFCTGVLCSTALTVFGADEPSDDGGSARITDLTGYTVTVPMGWSADSGYGQFDVVGTLFNLSENYPTLYTFYGLNIGYIWTGNGDIFWTTPSTNVICDNTTLYFAMYSSFVLELTFSGGNDVDNPRLIQWLYDNNATFVNNNQPITKQFYIFKDGVTHTCEYEDGMTLADWANSSYDTLGYAVVSGYFMINGLYEERSFVASSFVLEDCYRAYHSLEGGKGFVEQSTHIITEGETFYDYYNLDLYNECYATGYNSGYDKGYGMGEYQGEINGYDRGYLQGKTEGESSNIGDNLIGSGFSAITDSLNHIILYQSSEGTVVTLWVVICGAIGIALFIWVLKLFAGG